MRIHFQIDVTVAGLPDSNIVKCSRDVNIKPDIGNVKIFLKIILDNSYKFLGVSNASSKGPFDVIVLPGGLGGSKAMAESEVVGQLLKEQEKAGRWIAAICAGKTTKYSLYPNLVIFNNFSSNCFESTRRCRRQISDVLSCYEGSNGRRR